MPLYIKGYMIDPEKILAQFPRKPEDMDDEFYEISYYSFIIDNIPRLAYKYLASGRDSGGDSVLVFVLEHGYDRKTLEGITVTPDGFPKPSLRLLTLGIWEY